MSFKSDIEIAQEARLSNINEIAKELSIDDDFLEVYGKYMARLITTSWINMQTERTEN